MPKSALEKQLEKQMRQAKQLADRQRRDNQKQEREEKRAANKEATRQQAASIVNGQPLIEGFRIMDKTAEEMLQCLLACELKQNNQINYDSAIFPQYTEFTLPLELEKLTQYGMIGGLIAWMGGGMLTLLPQAISYFQEKEAALQRQKNREEEQKVESGNNIHIYGNVSGSQITVGDNNTITFNYGPVTSAMEEIKQSIDSEKINESDKQDALDLLAEISSKIESNKKPAIIKSALIGAKDFLISVGANVTAALIAAKMQGLF